MDSAFDSSSASGTGSSSTIGLSRKNIRQYEADRKRRYRQSVVATREQEENIEVSEPKRREVAQNLADLFLNETYGMDVAVRKDIFERFRLLPCMEKFQPKSHAEINEAIVSRVRSSLSLMKQPRSGEELFVKRSSMLMLMNQESSTTAEVSQLNLRATARALNIHVRNLYGARSRLTATENGQLLWDSCRRKARISIITEEIKELVFSFWLNNTRVSPNKKDVCRKRIGRKAYLQHPIHHLEISQVSRYF